MNYRDEKLFTAWLSDARGRARTGEEVLEYVAQNLTVDDIFTQEQILEWLRPQVELVNKLKESTHHDGQGNASVEAVPGRETLRRDGGLAPEVGVGL